MLVSITGDGVSTIQDVARLAAVSTATVSRYLSGEPVRASARIREVIAELGYRPSVVARGLRSGRHDTFGVVVPDVTNPFFAGVVRGIENVAGQRGVRVLLGNSDEDLTREATLVDDLSRRVDGMILAPATEHDDVPHVLASAGVPVVLLDRAVQVGGRFDSVTVDNIVGAKLAARHLLGLGHRRIATISGPLTSTPGRERHEAFLDELGAGGADLESALVEVADFREAGGRAAASRLLSLTQPPTALFVANNLMTVGALKALRALGVRVPEEVSVLGFDDLDLGALLDPPLTVIDRPTVEQGERAATVLVDRINAGAGPAVHVVLPVQLLVRQSTARPRRDPVKIIPSTPGSTTHEHPTVNTEQ